MFCLFSGWGGVQTVRCHGESQFSRSQTHTHTVVRSPITCLTSIKSHTSTLRHAIFVDKTRIFLHLQLRLCILSASNRRVATRTLSWASRRWNADVEQTVVRLHPAPPNGADRTHTLRLTYTRMCRQRIHYDNDVCAREVSIYTLVIYYIGGHVCIMRICSVFEFLMPAHCAKVIRKVLRSTASSHTHTLPHTHIPGQPDVVSALMGLGLAGWIRDGSN